MIPAAREVVVAASSINTPKILMLSGIGDGAHLRAHGVDVVADRPGVGANLQDHLELYLQFASKQPITLYKYWNLWGKAVIGAQTRLCLTGLPSVDSRGIPTGLVEAVSLYRCGYGSASAPRRSVLEADSRPSAVLGERVRQRGAPELRNWFA